MSIVFVKPMPWAKYTENREVQARMPPFRGGVLALTVLFSRATVVAYSGEMVNAVISKNRSAPIEALRPCHPLIVQEDNCPH